MKIKMNDDLDEIRPPKGFIVGAHVYVCGISGSELHCLDLLEKLRNFASFSFKLNIKKLHDVSLKIRIGNVNIV